jgi:hypothetical protein
VIGQLKLIEAAVVFAPRNFPSGTFFGLLLLDSSVKITKNKYPTPVESV